MHKNVAVAGDTLVKKQQKTIYMSPKRLTHDKRPINSAENTEQQTHGRISVQFLTLTSRSTKNDTAMYKSQSPSTATQRNFASSQLKCSFNICDNPIGFAFSSRWEKQDKISQWKRRESAVRLREKTSPGIHAGKTGDCEHSQKEKKR